MVRLQIDVEAANAQRQFEQTARAVDRLGDELDDAQDEASRLRFEFNMASSEADRLQRQVAATDRRLEDLRSTARAMGSAMPADLREEMRRTEQQSRQLHRELDRAENGARQLGQAMNAADDNVARLADELDDAEEEAAELRREMERTARAAASNSAAIRRAFAGLADEGRRAGRGFASGMGPPILAAAAAIAPVAGAAISAGLLTAIGGGVMGAAVAVAVKESDALQKAFTNTFRTMGDEVKVWASFFEDELFAVSDRFARVWDNISGSLGKAFAQAERFVEPFAEGISQLVEKMLGGGGFNAAMEAAEPVIKEFSRGLGKVGESLDSFFDSLADGGDGAVKGMIVLMATLAGAITATGNVIEFLAKAFNVVTNEGERWARSAEVIVGALEGMAGLLPGVADGWGWVGETLGRLNGEAGKTKDIMPIVGAATDGAAGAMERQAAAAEKAARAAYNLSNRLHGLISDQLSADQAALQWEQAIDAVTKSIEENGRTIDANTEKGQANVTAILAAVAAAEAKYQAAVKLAGGEKASAEAVAAANKEFGAQLDALAILLEQAGLTKDQIHKLLAAYQAVANQADITKQITIRYRYLHIGDRLHNPYELSGNYSSGIGGRAKGGPIAAGMPYLVGENGPEMIMPERDGRVMTASQTARMMRGSSSTWGAAKSTTSGGAVLRVEAAPGHAGNWLVQGFIAALHSGQLRVKAGPSGRIVPA